ncbi:MAG TPA: hypothetical protein VFS59_16265 [Gemmatimonadaceae bacterium]|nr:hypothetical protein [Gemmatimonadaceae bacterium]
MGITLEQLTQGWHTARLIPTAGIRGQEEQERRATSSLLAVVGAVPEFGHALFGPLGAPKGRIHTFTEVQFKDADGRTCIPDGAVVIERGSKRFALLVEVKTGDAELQSDQVSRYLDIARANSFDGVLTISNAITATPADTPVRVDRRKLRSTKLFHLSWWRVITEAIVQHRFRGVSDPDQAWILGELVAYLDHEASGASGFSDMGPHWVAVRDAAHAGTLRATDSSARAVCERWEQFMDHLALGLAQDLGREIVVVRPRKQAAEQRLQALVRTLAEEGALVGSVRVPDAVAPLDLRADLRTRRVSASVTVDAPREGRPLSRINWLLRQIAHAPGDLRIDVAFQGTRETTSVLLADAREDPSGLISPTDPKRIPRSLTITAMRPLGTKRGRGRGSVVADARAQAIDFYGQIVQAISPWRARPPRLPEKAAEPDLPATPDPPPFTDLDGRDIGQADQPAVSSPAPSVYP